MSLDDSDVLAGFGEGAPFFDNSITHGSGSAHNPAWGDGPTPRANPCDAPPANGKKGPQQQQQQGQPQGQAGNPPVATPASLKELKEIWKQYMRTPFSGSGQPATTHEHHPNGSPKRERGLARVASLPSVKTPSAATAGWGDPMRGQNGSQQQAQAGAGVNNVQYGGHAAYSRTHNHTDDLRSYGQAILARRAPLTLHLAPRRRGNTTSTGPPPAPSPKTATPHPPAPPSDKGARSSPAGSGSSSDRSMSVFTEDRVTSSRGSPAPGLGGSGGRSLVVDDATRPTFKRLPSQTLGPEYAKRPATTNMLSGAREGFIGMIGDQDIQQRGLGMAERARRMSFPSGRSGLVALQD
ncbi:hypothetical protein BJV78DRAFT_1243259 [Lactifluus subvellereus]|nr:hypothetical protein BJV78DRAFT_1243259 [Lactifluus subvellereus]